MTDTPDRDLVAAYLDRFSPENQASIAVMGDLAVFCGDQVTTARADPAGRIDPYAMAVAEGRRQVWNHILAMLAMPTSTAWRLAENERQRRRAANG